MDVVNSRAIRGEGTAEADWSGWPGLSGLAVVSAASLVPDGARAVVVAPHPDDEVLSVGGLLAQLARRQTPVQVIAVTDGTASHRGSSIWPAQRLAAERPRETQVALRCLGIDLPPLRLGLPDGELQTLRRALAERLVDLIKPSDVVFTTWRQDGHPDHEVTGNACAQAAARTGARLVEFPVWAWHWATPGDVRLPWAQACRLPLDADAASRKRCALKAYASQLHPDESTGAAPILRGATLDRMARGYEVFFT